LVQSPITFGQALRASRLRARLTQRELAERAGVSLRTIRYIELGQVERPRRESIERLAEVVDLPVSGYTLPAGDEVAATVHIGVLGPLAVTSGGAASGDHDGARADWTSALAEFSAIGAPEAEEIEILLQKSGRPW
jgi:transcriptional regulator with XRE-family HTH domain